MPRQNDFYSDAHIFVAAVRILSYQKNNTPPSVEDICGLLSVSGEWGNMMCRRLKQLGAVETLEDSFHTRVFVGNHHKLEEISREENEEDVGFAKDLEKFHESKKALASKVEKIQADLNQKKQNLFADLEKKLKEPEE